MTAGLTPPQGTPMTGESANTLPTSLPIPKVLGMVVLGGEDIPRERVEAPDNLAERIRNGRPTKDGEDVDSALASSAGDTAPETTEPLLTPVQEAQAEILRARLQRKPL